MSAESASHGSLSHLPLTHLDEHGAAHMVDVSEKDDTLREATARGRISMAPETLNLIESGTAAKGSVLGVAQLAGIMAAKQTGTLIPLCHPLPLTGVDVSFAVDRASASVEIEATARTVGKTGVEMEAMVAVSVAALTIYDMCKAVDRAMIIGGVRLVHKSGGKSGEFVRGKE
ncbi:MAG: cyclic pyranopterin monophosphate synthase MoaC [Chloroflexi bacterium]|nr:cyclic pyranopterin monophosphate synthase MoaC [Chloroflexota bacterium]